MSSHLVNWQDPLPTEVRKGAIAIGNFDGVHRGHGSLVAALRVQSRALGGPAVALTFDPHPRSLLAPGGSTALPPQLTTPADRAELLQALGADHVVTMRSTLELLQLSARDFFAVVVQGQFQARALVEGRNFGFGRNREGNIETLAELCRASGISLTVVPPQLIENGEVSSSRVRTALLAGDVIEASRLLGRLYRLHGEVGSGQQRGRTIGFPTANLVNVVTLIPADGVYAVRVAEDVRGRVWPGAANIGPNPTFGEQTRKIEIHLIGFQGDLYGRELAVDFVERLRPTRPFGSAAELIDQLRRDVEQARLIVHTL